MLKFKRDSSAYNYVFEKKLSANEEIILKIPDVSPNKKGICDIGWQSGGNVTIYGTLSSDPENSSALWQKIDENTDVNKTVSALKVINGSSVCNIAVRVILN